MMFIVALFLPWCRYLGAHCGVSPLLYADNLKCVSWDPGLLLRAARFTTGFVRLVGQEPLPVRVCCFVLFGLLGVRCVAGFFLSEVIGGLSSLMSETWVGILILRGGAGLPLYLPEYVLLFLVLILFLPFTWTFMVVFGCSCHDSSLCSSWY